jgi:hypothetical protein
MSSFSIKTRILFLEKSSYMKSVQLSDLRALANMRYLAQICLSDLKTQSRMEESLSIRPANEAMTLSTI